MNSIIIGTGYVGLVQAACLAKLGHNVAAVDIDEAKIARLRAGEVPFFEPGLAALVKEGMKSGRLTFHVGQEGAKERTGEPDAIFCCVQTPAGDDGQCDLRAVEAVAREVGERFSDTIFVIKSTTPPGTAKRVREWLANDSIRVAANPEFLREGTSVKDFFEPERIVIGAETEADAQTLSAFYTGVETRIFVTSIETAQLAKYAANTMLAMRLSLINEIANIADCSGADIKDVEAILGSDSRIGAKFLRAGAGFGGSCFPKDVLALARVAEEGGGKSLLIAPIIETNNRQPMKFVEKMKARLGGIDGKTIAVWGLAFNADTDDVRESPAMKIVRALIDGGARLAVFDPEAIVNAQVELGDTVRYAADEMDALLGADALAVLTEWPQFGEVDWAKVKQALVSDDIFDGKNVLDREKLEEHGLRVNGMGLCEKELRRPRRF